jgi:hypothetical protein
MRTKRALGVLTGMVLSGSAVAFEQCPEGMHVCATVLQVIGYGVLPSMLFWLFVAFWCAGFGPHGCESSQLRSLSFFGVLQSRSCGGP